MSYLVFARKFRPQTFDEVIGQEPIVTTLKNAISSGRVAQSFLFTGSRGVGKTSTARILAKALNCEKGPSPTPCNKCSTCEEITEGTSLDILEIDGASNRGIDEIRSLREGVKFKPAHGRYKLYIIDEVHMLTGEAFNALLKTLEEPPEHVKFIFATTEAHKVPLTILSRCQRFNFRRIPTATIAEKLKEVAQKEKIKADDNALFLIAKHSEGSLRDGESLLDQLASFGDGKVVAEDVEFSLGLTGEGVYFLCLEALAACDGKRALQLVAGVTEEGKDPIQFSKGLLELFRDLLVCQTTRTTDHLEGTEERMVQVNKFRDTFSRAELLFSLALLQRLVRDIRWSETPRFLIEVCLVKIANRSDLREIDEILNELRSLETNTSQVSRHSEAPKGAKHLGRDPSGASRPDDDGGDVKRDALRKKKDDLTGQILGEAASMVHHAPPEGQAALARSARAEASLESVTLIEVGSVWPDLLERVKGQKMSCGTFLAESEPVDVMDGIVVFGLSNEFKFHKEALEEHSNKELVRSTLSALLNRKVGVSFVVTEPVSDVTVKKSEPESRDKRSAEIITSALDIFKGSRIIRQE